MLVYLRDFTQLPSCACVTPSEQTIADGGHLLYLDGLRARFNEDSLYPITRDFDVICTIGETGQRYVEVIKHGSVAP